MAFLVVAYGVVRYCRDDFVLCEKQAAVASLGKVGKALDVGEGVVKAISACATINVKGPISQFYAIFKSGERVRIVFISGKALNVRFGKRAFDRIEIAYGEVRSDFLLL